MRRPSGARAATACRWCGWARDSRLTTNEILFCVFVWGVVGVLVYFATTSRQWCGVGLTLAFFLDMALLHWFSGMILILPWYTPLKYYATVDGFRMSTIGIGAFALGCFGIAPLLTQRPSRVLSLRDSASDSRIFRIFLTVGIASFLLIGFGLGTIPTLSAVLSSGQGFLFVALGLGIWQSYLRQNRKQLLLFLSVTPAFPLLTIFVQGFLGFGVGYAIIVLCFFVSIYRPRVRTTLFIIPLAYLGLSFYVTYMRDRSALRAAVWGGSKIETRVDQLISVVQHFEWFDPWDRQHLERVDVRLNYNWLVGAAMSHLQMTKGFGRGETLWMGVVTLVPRAIWPDKPIQTGSMDFVTRYAGVPVPEGTSMGMGLIFEFYANFGVYGVLMGMLVMGILVGFSDRKAGAELRWGSPIAFARWMLIGTFLLIVGGTLIEIIPGIVLSVIWTTGLKHLCGESFATNGSQSTPAPDIDASYS